MNPHEHNPSREHIVVVADPDRLTAEVERHVGPCQVIRADSYLAGIALAAEPATRAVVAGVEHGPRRLAAAVAGLRAAADRDVPVVLCCRPHDEPLARRLLEAGADDYVIYPPMPGELEAALSPSAVPEQAGAIEAPDQTSAVGADELAELATVLAHLDAGLPEVLARLAGLIQRALPERGVEVRAYDHTARVGLAVRSPSLTERLTDRDEYIGQVVLGPGPNGADEVVAAAKLRHYARLCSAILGAHRRGSAAREEATTDSVSGMKNRRYLDRFVTDVVARAARGRFRVTLLLFDIDNFKYYNDTYGHVAGDEILREIGQLTQRCCRRHDVVARFGGDEFAVVFWDADEPRVAGSKHPTDPLSVVDRFRDALLNHRFDSLGPDARGRLTISGGLATFPWEASSAEDLVRQADANLLAAKAQGKNRVLPIGRGWLGKPVGPSTHERATPAREPSTPAGKTTEEA